MSSLFTSPGTIKALHSFFSMMEPVAAACQNGTIGEDMGPSKRGLGKRYKQTGISISCYTCAHGKYFYFKEMLFPSPAATYGSDQHRKETSFGMQE